MIYHPNLYLVDFLLSIFTIGILVVVGYFVFKAMQKADVIPALNTEERKARKQAKKVSKSVDELSSVLFGLKKVKGKRPISLLRMQRLLPLTLSKVLLLLPRDMTNIRTEQRCLAKHLRRLIVTTIGN